MPQTNQKEYQVLARKYRPATLSGLIGQDVLVRTLSNAIESGRMPHAFILTGIRGVGKTSTARIIARSLVCVGADGKSEKPTLNPCGVCEQCKAISEDRHVDIMEMDAASHTGVDEVRQIIDNVNYMPVMARYRIYIIDEVHMLTRNAFNALLKTLEEPPPHSKFIFATTEIRKIPVTILSRCMRFDLHRIDEEILSNHLKNIARKEGIEIEDDAITQITHASEGSVRDALSLLDQAIGMNSGGSISRQNIQTMLGLADRSSIFNIFEYVISGKPAEAIRELKTSYQAGANPVTILQDMLELSHFITQIKVIPAIGNASHIPESDRNKGKSLAEKLSIPFLTRVWQILLKGISETQIAPNSLIAAEMILIRLAYISDLPTPGEIIKNLGENKNTAPIIPASPASNPLKQPQIENASLSGIEIIPTNSGDNKINSFNEMVNIFNLKGEHFICSWLQDVRVVSFNAKNRNFTFHPSKTSPPDLAGKISELLTRLTGERWIVAVSNEEGGKSIAEEKQEKLKTLRTNVENDEFVKAVLDSFPGAAITEISEAKEKV